MESSNEIVEANTDQKSENECENETNTEATIYLKETNQCNSYVKINQFTKSI